MRLLTYADLKPERGIPYSSTHLWRLIKAGKFPKPMKGSGPGSLNLWTDEQIDDHIKSLIAERDGSNTEAA